MIQQALSKVWEFTKEFADRTFCEGQLRVVVSRIGRLGFGETNEWARLMQFSARWSNWTSRPNKPSLSSFKLSLVSGLKTQFEIEIFTCSAYLTSIEPDATIRIVQEPKKTYKAISQSKLAQLKPEEVQSAHIAVFATTPSARESTGDEKNSANQNDDFDLELGWTDAMNDDENEDRKWLRFAARNLMPVFF